MEQRRHGHSLAARLLIAALLTPGLGACGGLLGARGLPPLPRDTQVFASENHYEVSGTTVSEIGRSLHTGASAALGGDYTGLHRWRMGYNYRYLEEGAGLCRVKEVSIELHSEISLPEWLDRERADPAIVEQWDTFITHLRAHEYGHRRHAYEAARELSRELKNVRAPACGMISLRVGATSRRILDKYSEIDDEWDADPANRVHWPPGGSDAQVSRDPAGAR
jgi:predicted secreted Zn-dependent protease